MQIWKSPYMFAFVLKCYPENLAFLIVRILELFTREVCILKFKNFKRKKLVEIIFDRIQC